MPLLQPATTLYKSTPNTKASKSSYTNIANDCQTLLHIIIICSNFQIEIGINLIICSGIIGTVYQIIDEVNCATQQIPTYLYNLALMPYNQNWLISHTYAFYLQRNCWQNLSCQITYENEFVLNNKSPHTRLNQSQASVLHCLCSMF